MPYCGSTVELRSRRWGYRFVDWHYPAALDPTAESQVSLLTNYAAGSPLTNTGGTNGTITVQEKAGIGKYLRITAPFSAGGYLSKTTDAVAPFTFAAVVGSGARHGSCRQRWVPAAQGMNRQRQLCATGNVLINGSDAGRWLLGSATVHHHCSPSTAPNRNGHDHRAEHHGCDYHGSRWFRRADNSRQCD